MFDKNTNAFSFGEELSRELRQIGRSRQNYGKRRDLSPIAAVSAIKVIIRVVSDECGVEIDPLIKKDFRGENRISHLRMLSMGLCAEFRIADTSLIAYMHGRKNHSSTNTSRKFCSDMLETEPNGFGRLYRKCKRLIEKRLKGVIGPDNSFN